MATLQSGGFARPTVMANPGLVDPRLLAADYQGIAQGIGQGLKLVNNFSDRQQLALDRADANALREARVAAQRAQLEIEPQLLNNNLALSNVGVVKAQNTPIELAEGSTISRTPTGDIVSIDTFTQIDPVTGARSTVGKSGRPLALSEDLRSKEAASNAAVERLRLAEQANQARADTAKVAAENARIQAEAAKTRAEAYAKGIDNGSAKMVTPDLVFNRRNAQNLADLDEVLGLGSVTEIQKFGGTKEGRAIIDKINTDKANRLSTPWQPGQLEFLNSYRAAITDMANQPAAAGSAPTAAAETLPAASPVREVTSPPKPDIRQNGVLYRWNGTQYVPAQ